ncbi:MAG: nitrate/nitrite transporter NrtS [Solirubrobacterales bacterium]|nr:nitrate/nitrite transporter NrtS [Solirubrobacterales bacterium]
MRDALSIVFRREHLRKTVRIALVVGCVLTVINQLDVFLGDKATTLTFVKTGLNFCVPFVVSNLGLLAGKRAEQAAVPSSERVDSGIRWNPDVTNSPRKG